MNTLQKAAAEPNADQLIDTILGYRKAKTLMVAVYLDCFNHLEKPRSALQLAKKLSLDSRAMEILLDALVAMGYLLKEKGCYHNSPTASRFLVKGRPEYLGDNLKYQEIIWDAWSELRHAVKKGGAVRPLDYWLLRHPGFIEEYIRGMDNIARKTSEEIVALVGADDVRNMLDVGAGPGTYSMAFLRRNPLINATLLDIPETLKITKQIISERSAQLLGSITLMEGDYRRTSFGNEAYDLVLLSHITHDESPETNRHLITESYRALRLGGKIVIHDFMVEDSRVVPEFGALFSVHMLAYTQGGRTYTASEYSGWLKKAGFTRLTQHKIAINSKNSSEIIIGIK